MAESAGSFTIGGTTPDYATIQLWDDDAAGTLTGVLEGKVRAGEYAENVNIGGSTTTASNYKKLTYDTGAFHAGVFGAGVVLRPVSTQVNHVFTLAENYTRVIGIEATEWYGASSEAFRVGVSTAGNNCRIEQCLMHSAADINADGIHIGITNVTVYVQNCFFGWLGRAGIYTQSTSANGFAIYANNCTAVYVASMDSAGVAAFGDDTGNPPTSGNWFIKNCYGHVNPSDAATGPKAFQLGGGGSAWHSSSTHNASADASASDVNATYYQNNAAVDDQILQSLTRLSVGDNTGNDVAGSWETTWMDSANPTTPHGSDVGMDIDNTNRNALFRCSLANVSSSARLKWSSVFFNINDNEGFQSEWFKCLRNWVQGEATWNVWSTGNSWTTGGALGHNTDIYDHASQGGLSGQATSRSHSFADAQMAVGDWLRTTGGALFTEYVQSAIDNASGAPKGDDYIDVMWDWLAGGTTVLSVDSVNDTDGERPYIELWYDTAAAPFDAKPDPAGVLDGNGTDLSADGYPVTVDITGSTRSAWDIGAWKVGEIHSGAASLTGTATLAAKPTRLLPGASATLAGTGTLAAVSEVVHSAAGAVTGTATIAAAPRLTLSGASALSASATVAPSAAVDHVASAALSGVASVYIQGGEPVIWLRPDGDITVTNFEDEGGGTTNLYQKIDETVRSDADYIRSSGGSGIYECSLTAEGVPSPDTYHAIEYACRRGPDVLGTELDMEFQVRQGSTIIASWTEVAISNQAWEGRRRYLTDEQVVNITDYGDLRLRVIVGPTQKLLTYKPGDPVGTFTRTGSAWEWYR